MPSPARVWLPLLLLLTTLVAANSTGQENSAGAQLPVEELRLFTQVFDQVRRGYVDEINDSELLISAVEGLLYKLDPYSRYLDADAYRELRDVTSGNFTGIGVEVATENGVIRVISPLDSTPAQRAGIRSNDLIVAIDGASLRGLSPSAAAYKLRGPKGSEIELTLQRGSGRPFNISMTRDTIDVDSITYRLLDNFIGYLRIAQFQQGTGDAFNQALDGLRRQRLDGLVIDLRNNPGGLVQSAVAVASSLLDGDTVVYTEGRLPSANQLLSAELGDRFDGAPVVVLINGGTASAAEIVAGALQDNRRAVIVGTRSFGKGSVQTIIPIDDERALKLTTARYFTPNGRSIQADGIHPDIVVERGTLQPLAEQPREREENVGGHLDGAVKNVTITLKPKLTDAEQLLKEDNQLAEAVNLLRGALLLRQ